MAAFSSEILAASFRATLDRDTVSVGETVNLSLIFRDGSPDSQPVLPNIPGVQLGGTTASKNFSFANGKTTSEVTYTYVLMPQKAGEITIPSIRTTIDHQNFASDPLKLKVSQTAVSSETNAEGQSSEAFLKLILPKTNLYVGEILPAEIRLYVQFGNKVSLPQIPAEGFTISPMTNRPEQTRADINGINYNILIFRFTLSATKPGMLTLGPATCSLNILSGPQRDLFGGLVFSNQRRATLLSETNFISVQPLPTQNKPQNFNGAVGQFSLNVSASPTEVAVGDPITVKVDISGRGALENLTLPQQPSWREFKSYSPNSQFEPTDPLGIAGTKHFELVISPENAGITELPPLHFSFFDPEQKQYRTLTSQPIPLKIRAGAATPQPTVISANASSNSESQQQTKEIVHIKPALGKLETIQKPLLAQPWFLALQIVPPVIWLGAIFQRKRKENFDKNPKLRRQKAVEKSVQAGLEQLKLQAAANESDAFFANVFRLLQERIGERLDLPTSGITESVLDHQLKNRLSAESLASLRQLFDLCNQARYAPVRGSQQLAALIPKVEQALNELKQLK